jgi:hypothetical protein
MPQQSEVEKGFNELELKKVILPFFQIESQELLLYDHRRLRASNPLAWCQCHKLFS